MSIVVCDYCDSFIDSDVDPDCFMDNEGWCANDVLCERCRERAWDRHQERLMEDGPGPSLLDQQIAAQRLK